MSGKVGLLYVKNKNTVQLLSDEITTLLGAENIVDSGVEEQAIKSGELTPVVKKVGKNLSNVNSLIVITDNAFWDRFWSEKSNKVHNKLEELLCDDDGDGVTLVLIVGCNIDQGLIETLVPSSSHAHVISEEDLKKYLSKERKPPSVCHMVVSIKENNSESIKELSKQIVEKYGNQSLEDEDVCKDKVDTPTQTPTLTFPVTPQWPTTKERVVVQTAGPNDDASENPDIDFSVPSMKSDDVDNNETRYDISRPGLCLYIGVLEFDPEDSKVKLAGRKSSMLEFEKMKDSFECLGCFVKRKSNPTDTEALKFLQQGMEWCEKLKPSYFVLIISTHGQEVPQVNKEDKSAKLHPSGIKEKGQPKKEMVHQLFFNNGKSLLTRDIVKMFDDCPSLADKPCFFFIQACRSRFGIDGHENFDPGVMVDVFTPRSQIEAAQITPDTEDASGNPKLLDKTDAKRSTAKLTEEDKKARLQQIEKWNKNAKIATLYTHILEYKNWLSNQTGASQTRSQDTSEETAKLAEALTVEGFTFQKVQEILETCKGYEVDILDFFFPEMIISDPAPCTNDSAIMFASAPGKEAYNRGNKGGWLIINMEEQLKESLKDNPENVDLLAELTKVSGRMAYKYETDTDSSESSGHKSVPCLYHKLCKDVIICPQELARKKKLLENHDNSEYSEFFKWA
ncbi:uncharacterized protein LOC130051874 [Ostrea edulis]|uniref:uncharacterized protein LOC130051874 n=1 Tax=Ostrea edulis TaxID=37623 RepID=UPI0024AF3ED1|nr:uncharacterized protein LOC130051874 [Ostrea edulis]